MTKRRPDMRDPSTDSLNLRDVVGSTHTTDPLLTVTDGALPAAALGLEADVILIAHPENRRLGHRFRLSPGGSLDIGRAPTAQVSLPEVPSLSRSHARLRFVGNRVVLEDLGSRNGTFVNGQRIVQSAPLVEGTVLRVGGVEMVFRATDGAVAAVPVAARAATAPAAPAAPAADPAKAPEKKYDIRPGRRRTGW